MIKKAVNLLLTAAMTDLFPVLVAEDDRNDVFLLKRALRNAGVCHPLQFVADGQQAIDYLSGLGEFTDRQIYPMPGLMILDIKMPKRTGLEVLQWARQKFSLKELPAIITSSSKLEVDIEEALRLGANAYLVKPVPVDELLPFFTRRAFPSMDQK